MKEELFMDLVIIDNINKDNMESFTREIITATQRFDENDKLSKMLAVFAQELFEEGLIKISTRYDKDTGEIYKELSAKLMREVREER